MSIATNNNGNDQQYAAAQILNNTPELLDKIPSQQDIFHIIRAQRVSTQWKNITAGSKKLQEALFIRQVTRDGSHLGTTCFNSLASNADPLAFAPGGDFRPYEGGRYDNLCNFEDDYNGKTIGDICETLLNSMARDVLQRKLGGDS
ncbi:hypothetical protein DOTSEDRAFT_27691 [Dothistroma septosporum NZE10]|uniref:F-box domain-containing protein n=1 Tax=Dothistroma septosporum (strain NZE10 / CBS 128990) TaxID=675120 RepID=N1PFH1_DOTSN|nr:hypothetical protein DOTSEDRAFT_27691 [Dothistroma septosporum NZE10]